MGAVILEVDGDTILAERLCRWSVTVEKGSSNLGELLAIQKALESIPTLQRWNTPIRVYTDSQYARQAIEGKFKSRVFGTTIRRIQRLSKLFPSFRIRHCQGHTGRSTWNNVAHHLSRSAAGIKSAV